MRNAKKTIRGATILAAAALMVYPAMARENGAVSPNQKASVSSSRTNGTQQIVPSLKGLVFVSSKTDVHADGVTSEGVNTSAVKMLDTEEFRNKLAPYLGRPLTFAQLDQITHSVVVYFSQRHHPLVDAIAPAQSVENGVIQIVVTEFRVANVKAEGNRWFSDDVVTKSIDLHPGDTVDSARLLSQVDAANSNPFRRVNLVYQPAADQGYTDILLQTQDHFPLRVSTGFDNGGTPVTGRNRWEMGVNWGNALWHDQQLSYQFSSSTDFFTGGHGAPGENGASFVGHSINWSMPVRGRDSFSIFGSYDRSVPNIGQDFGLVGLSGQASMRYSLALPRTRSFVQTLQAGYDFKTTNNNLAFGGTLVARTNAEIDQLPLIYAGNLTDGLGSTALTTSLTVSPGHISGNNTNAAFQPADGQSGRALASARYLYWRTDANRLTKLPAGAVWSLRLMGQMSTANLLYTEQLAGGGPEILRGYDPNSILGDQGVVVSNELRSPAFRKTSGEGAWLGQMQVLGFWDWAHLSSVHPVEDAINHLNASSVGMGVRYNLRSNLTAKFDYGWQLQHLPGAGDRDHLLNFALMTSY